MPLMLGRGTAELNCKANKASTQIGYCFSSFFCCLSSSHAFHVAPPLFSSLFCNIHAFFDALSVLSTDFYLILTFKCGWKNFESLFEAHRVSCLRLIMTIVLNYYHFLWKRRSIKVIDLHNLSRILSILISN